MKSGGSSRDPGAGPQPNPQGVVPYGNTGAASTMFKPNFTSVLPEDQMATAQLSDPVRQVEDTSSPLLAQQQAQAMAAANAPKPQTDPRRSALAALMSVFGRGSMPGALGGTYQGGHGGDSGRGHG